MTKVKINYGLASIIVLASLFAGWQTLLIVIALLLLFCEVDEQLKNVIIRVVTFFIGLTLVTMIWNLIVDGCDVLFNSIHNIFRTINSFLSYENQIDITKLDSHFINPATYLINIANDVLTYVFVLIKVLFIIETLKGKNIKDNFISLKIRNFTDKAISYIGKIEFASQQETQREKATEEFNANSYDS